ncbi:lipoxygenase family protein [Mycobacterium sp.]|uniref:lipoxygenase family protein n=1 Tax=Mycobacterium sp. TaxID=1785 RepID=UPI003F9BAAFB
MSEAIPYVEVHKVMVCPRAQVPRDERTPVPAKFYDFQVRLYSTALSPMLPGLPPISADPQVALKRAFNGLRRRLFHDPELPAEYLGSPDLGSLAVRGPFACYTRRPRINAPWEWDLRMLNDYEHHPGLVKIGSRVVFREDPVRHELQAYRIECALGKIEPTDPEWDQACKIALCAASTHLSLVRHFNWVHLAGGAQLAIATRNRLPTKHSLFRLLWPYIFGTMQSNDMVTRGQMAPGGDFETTFSFTFKGMCELFDDTYTQYQHSVNDPEKDGNSRYVRGVSFATPTQDNLKQLFDVMHQFVCDYLKIYYADTKALQNDANVMGWLDELNVLLPNGVDVNRKNVTWDTFARMLAGQLYLVTVQHEILGSHMWNYQLWIHRQPARIYQDFRSEPLDVYQRLVNANYILNVHRRRLMHNFNDIALDDYARAAMLRFQGELLALQARMDSHPHAIWRLYPRELKVNINA